MSLHTILSQCRFFFHAFIFLTSVYAFFFLLFVADLFFHFFYLIFCIIHWLFACFDFFLLSFFLLNPYLLFITKLYSFVLSPLTPSFSFVPALPSTESSVEVALLIGISVCGICSFSHYSLFSPSLPRSMCAWPDAAWQVLRPTSIFHANTTHTHTYKVCIFTNSSPLKCLCTGRIGTEGGKGKKECKNNFSSPWPLSRLCDSQSRGGSEKRYTPTKPWFSLIIAMLPK